MVREMQRILAAHGLTLAEWAVLSAASYYSPLPLEHVVETAVLEAEGKLGDADLSRAFVTCRDRGWLESWQPTRGQALAGECRRVGLQSLPTGIVLTDL